MDFSDLHKALVKRAVKYLKDKQEQNARAIWEKHISITGYKCVGWVYSWYVYNASKGNLSSLNTIDNLHPSLYYLADKHIEQEEKVNEIVISVALYIDRVLTLNDQCFSYIHVYLPATLHPTLKQFMIGLDPKASKLNLELTQTQLKGRDELYALSLLEITGG